MAKYTFDFTRLSMADLVTCALAQGVEQSRAAMVMLIAKALTVPLESVPASDIPYLLNDFEAAWIPWCKTQTDEAGRREIDRKVFEFDESRRKYLNDLLGDVDLTGL